MGTFCCSKFLLSRPRTAPRRPKTRPRRPKMAPRRAQDGTRTVKRAMLKRVGLRKASERETIEKTKENQCFSVCRSVAFGKPRRPQDAPRRPQDAPRRGQDGPRWLQDAPKMLPRRSQDTFKTEVEARCASEA